MMMPVINSSTTKVKRIKGRIDPDVVKTSCAERGDNRRGRDSGGVLGPAMVMPVIDSSTSKVKRVKGRIDPGVVKTSESCAERGNNKRGRRHNLNSVGVRWICVLLPSCVSDPGTFTMLPTTMIS